MVPNTTTSRAFTPACSFPFGPTVRRCSCSSTEPSISPSIVRSSRLKIWPLIMTDFPMIAGPLDSVGWWLGAGLVDIGTFSLIWLVGATGVAGDFGGYSSSFRLFHIRKVSLVQSRSIMTLGIFVLPVWMQPSYYARWSLSFACYGGACYGVRRAGPAPAP